MESSTKQANRVMVIAEPGCTAEGDYGAYVRLIYAAEAAGCDVFKPQWCSNPQKMCERRHIGPDHPKRAYYERAYNWLNFPLEWHEDFARMCKQFGMQYACTSFLPEDVAKVDPFVSIHKIASFEACDPNMYAAMCLTNKKCIVSTGMLNDNQVVDVGERFIVLHCVSAYPAPLSAMNLGVLRFDEEEMYQGLSDHSRNVLTGAVAVGAGAEIIETHFRNFDCSPENPDYAVSFSPQELKQYVANVRAAEAMMGGFRKTVQSVEEWGLPYRVTA